MLKPKYIEQLPDRMIELYSQVEIDILADMARRISTYDYFIPAAQWQYRKMIEMGNFHSFIMEALSSITGLTKQEIERLMEEAGMKALAFDDSIYRKAGLNPPPLAASPGLQAVLAAGIDKTGGLFQNLTRTTARTATKQFENALDRAYMQISTGAFDYNSAIRMAVKDLASKGVASITYPSGKTDSLEVCVRRAVVTGVNQTALKLQDQRAEEMQCDLVDVSAHAGARTTGIGPANHASWQGGRYSRSGTHPKYPSLVEVTGYGSGEGLGGWGCRHSMYPAFEWSGPLYTQEDLDEMDAPKYTYNGQKLTEEEATRRQRYLERQIRRWKREEAAMKAAGLSTDEAKAKVAKWQGVQRDFIDQTGLKRQYYREQIGGKVALSESRREKLSYLQNIKPTLQKVTRAGDTTLQHTLKVDSSELVLRGVVPQSAEIGQVRVIAGYETSANIRIARKLAESYGGNDWMWQKKSGIITTDNFSYEVHWYEYNGAQYENKLKGVKRIAKN